MKPEDFGISITQRASELRRAHMARFAHIPLDSKTACWLVPYKHQENLWMEASDTISGIVTVSRKETWTFYIYDVPVRWTVGDPPDTPEIQLVMEADLFAHERRARHG